MKLFVACGLLLLCACNAFAADSPYLFVWAADADKQESDFLAVLDANSQSPTYGNVITTVEVGFPSGAHHSEHRMPEDAQLFVNGFRSGRSYVIDLREPLKPQLAADFAGIENFSYPHSFERLPGGNVLATFQNTKGGQKTTGGVVELTPSGRHVRSSSAADTEFPEIRPYSLLPLPDDDLLVTTTSDMLVEVITDSIQLWRLSDLSLLRTLRIPKGPGGYEHLDPAEVRLMADGKTLLVNTFNCGLYQIHDAATASPGISHVFTFGMSKPTDELFMCALPVTTGQFWIQTVPIRNGIVSLDLSDPDNPKEVGYANLGEGNYPHWIALEPSERRIVVTGSGGMLNSVMMITVDPVTGALAIDHDFGEDGIASFSGSNWPHGLTGPAVPHGSVFSIP